MSLHPLGTAPRFPADALHHALAEMPEKAWGSMGRIAQSGTFEGYRVAPLVVAGCPGPEAPRFAFVLDAFRPVWAAWVSWLEPGGYILSHIDQGPYRERWQVALWPAGVGLTGRTGEAFRVQHWEPHRVVNRTDRPRIHLVVDRDLIVDATETPYQRFEESI
jgi:hypothetical protein